MRLDCCSSVGSQRASADFTVVSRACIRLHALPHQSSRRRPENCIFLAPSERDMYIHMHMGIARRRGEAPDEKLSAELSVRESARGGSARGRSHSRRLRTERLQVRPRLRAWGRVERDENSSARGGRAGARRPRGRSHSRRPRTERLWAWGNQGKVEKERRGVARREARVRRDGGWQRIRRGAGCGCSVQLYPVRVR